VWSEAVFDAMIDELHRGSKVEVRHFGSFRRRERRARRGRNPLTGALVEVPAKSVVYFTPSQDLEAYGSAVVYFTPSQDLEAYGSAI
jgi:nucleoid DNA-binding protein